MNKSPLAVVALLNGQFDPFWEELELGVKAASKKLEREAEYLSPPNPSWDEERAIAWQIETLDKLADREIGAVAVAMLHYEKAERQLNRLAERKVPLITYDCTGIATLRTLHVGTNNVAAGQQAGYALATEMDFRGKVVIDTPSMNVTSCQDRIAGFRQAIERYKEIQEVEVVTGSQSEERMRARAEETLKTHPDVKGIFCAAGTSGKSNGKAVKAAGRQGEIKIISFDATPVIIELIKEGVIAASVAQRPFIMGFRTVEYLTRLADDGPETTLRSLPPSRSVDTGSRMVSKATLDSYRESLVNLGIPVKF